ncbi:MAG TPA: prepilin-type N-terminal cleavage/methylation domain-containing protein [Phycisphaerae bacterium]|jgi:general secretion pathway protein G|nr:prepilin-type N-terminal cleavage/methylation domain-containing protein [Phycisphaerae bacterium]
MCSSRSAKRAFTLVEILIVVIILGILAAIVIPQFANASSDARVSNLRTTLNNVRNQIEVFKSQHNESAPALSCMWTIMLQPSDTNEAASNAPAGTKWGPYLQAAPINPYNNMTGVTSAATDTNAGWFYQPSGLGFTFYPRNADGTVNQNY